MTLCRFSSALLLVALLATGNAVHAEATTDGPLPSRPLNLSLPKDAVWSGMVRSETLVSRSGREGTSLPDLGGRMGNAEARGRLPYGSGYEARQRESGADHVGMNAGSQGQGRGGMGRGR